MSPIWLKVLPKIPTWAVLGYCAGLLTIAPAKADVPVGYRQVAQLYQVPEQFVYGIALNESGKTLDRHQVRPWPWTLNVDGKGYAYPTRKACWLALTRFLAQGKKLVDIGLMQVNWHYHQEKLGDPWLALDPYANLHIGVRILRDEYERTHDWFQAVGRYHSPGSSSVQRQRADQYARRVFRRLSNRLAAL